MKRDLLLFISLILIISNSANAQFGRLVNKVANSVTRELTGKPEVKKDLAPEPACACDDAILILDLGGKLQIDYAELSITVGEDGNILARDINSDSYYIVKNGVTEGPYKSDDPLLAEFSKPDDSEDKDFFLKKYKSYITRSGDKYTINFGGKKYGPYSLISSFIVTKTKDKFVAVVTENVMVTEDQGKKDGGGPQKRQNGSGKNGHQHEIRSGDAAENAPGRRPDKHGPKTDHKYPECHIQPNEYRRSIEQYFQI